MTQALGRLPRDTVQNQTLSTITASVLPLSLPCLGDGEQRDVVSGLLNGYPQGEMYLYLTPDPNTQLPNRHIRLTVSQRTQIQYVPTVKAHSVLTFSALSTDVLFTQTLKKNA